MSGWKDDVVEQLAISQFLLQSKAETAERLSMIIVDNAVEYLLKAYVEVEINGVGSGAGKVVRRQDWENNIRPSFDKLLDLIGYMIIGFAILISILVPFYLIYLVYKEE